MSNGLKQKILAQAKALSGLAEVYRCRQLTLLVANTLALGISMEKEIFRAVYGDPQGRKYWQAQLSEPIGVYTLAYTLSVHLAENVQQVEMATIAIIRAFRDAAEAGELTFIGDISPLLAVKDLQTNFTELKEIKVEPRGAVEWLLGKPKREHLVPASLRRFLGPSPMAARPISKKTAKRFVDDFIRVEQEAGRSPTLTRLESAAKKAGLRGGREDLREAFRQSPYVDVHRGRPQKASPKIAEK